MGHINGNTKAVVQIREIETDEYKADRIRWKDAFSVNGTLDLLDGGVNLKMMSRIEDADYIFICDYFAPSYNGEKLTAENSRLLIDGEVYEVKLFDDPMCLHEHLEIYLKYLGGQ